MSLKRIPARALDLAKSLALTFMGLAALVLALLFPRMFGGQAHKTDVGLNGPDVSHADIPYAEGGYVAPDPNTGGCGGSDCGTGSGSS